jgi:hypothetical protein
MWYKYELCQKRRVLQSALKMQAAGSSNIGNHLQDCIPLYTKRPQCKFLSLQKRQIFVCVVWFHVILQFKYYIWPFIRK